MASSSANPVKQEHPTGDSFITVKKEHPTDDSFITVKVTGLNHRRYDFRVKRHVRIQQIKTRWKDLEGMADYETVVFIFDGRRIKDDDDKSTVNDIGLKDGDCIHAMPVMLGD